MCCNSCLATMNKNNLSKCIYIPSKCMASSTSLISVTNKLKMNNNGFLSNKGVEKESL